MYTKTTKKISITVNPYYLEDQSEPEDQHYVWAYQVTINNLSNKTLNHSGKWFKNFAVWTSGSIATAKVEKTEDILGENIFNNNAVTIGVDSKTKKNNTFGFAFTQIHRDTEIGNDIIYIDTVAHNITTYANIKLNEKQWFDILLGGGDIEKDIARHLSTTVNTANRLSLIQI